MYLHFKSLLYAKTSQTIKNSFRGRHKHPRFTQSISWLLMPWLQEKPGHQQPWYWHGLPRIICVSRLKVNSLATGRSNSNFRSLIFRLILVTDGWGISFEIALRWKSLDLIDDKSTLVHVMAWCRQATSYYLSQCWPSFLPPYGINSHKELSLCILN